MKQQKKFIFGLSGKILTEREINFLQKSQPLGIILFSRNIENKNQLANLTESITNLIKDVKIFIDQEGGRVQRIKFTENYPTSKYFADIYQRNPEQAKIATKENYSKIMSELKNYNIDSPCSPVCDLLNEEGHGIIGDRSFGDNVDQVVALCKEAISGIKENNGIPIIKHIPGHGRASVDSHEQLPIITTDLETLRQTDFQVFKQLANEGVWAMTAHVVYECLDKNNPVTLSLKAISYIRNDIGFKGELMTDDICMKALHPENKVTIESLIQVTKQSFEAGCDIVLHCSGNIDEMEALSSV